MSDGINKPLDEQEPRPIPFITPEYEDLFSLKDGESLTLRYMDGSVKSAPCHACSSDEHFYFGHEMYHIRQFAEINRANGIICAPTVPHPENKSGYYEVYQLRRTSKADYRFTSYALAKEKIKATDYTHVYSGMMPEGMTLDRIYALHNRKDRPFPRRMTSLSVSDILIITKAGCRRAFYVDSCDFKELPASLETDLSKRRKRRKSPRQTEPAR